MMLKLAGFAAVALLLIVPSPAHAKSTTDARVAACVSEAQSAHDWAFRLEPSLRPLIEAQRKKLSDVCVSLSNAHGLEAEELLAACEREAAAGPRHIQRGRNMDRAHIARQRAACRALAAK